eukprot:CAMPEP_0198228552 /NCGR_PEP_ID=MMETSP1445-20131203/113559_1 /TAXON_ID=36898 /ORGANISM="Pyramimonas sp., Strain CCMP2087" /LENGTH=248 /DNA_ID=CAMNT_0043908937 /DNA_START=194 /DNA_END=937 /DNA_ORIENTATION=-
MAKMNRKIGEWKGGKFVREDDGESELMCLTLHQPLASLMAYGLKRVEGRVWSSDYTGPLWIHAAAKEVSPEEIAEIEAFYTEVFQRDTLSDSRPKFPAHYPTSCLVGRVKVAAVVPKEEFERHETMPPSALLENEANGSDYFFLCESAERLVLPFQMGGQHKLWKLDKKTADAAKKGLRASEQMPIHFLRYMTDPAPRSPPADSDVSTPEQQMLEAAIAFSLEEQRQPTDARKTETETATTTTHNIQT